MRSSPDITGGASGHVQLSKGPARDWTEPFNNLSPAARLDRLADAELAHGHEQRALYLVARADALRAVPDGLLSAAEALAALVAGEA